MNDEGRCVRDVIYRYRAVRAESGPWDKPRPRHPDAKMASEVGICVLGRALTTMLWSSCCMTAAWNDWRHVSKQARGSLGPTTHVHANVRRGLADTEEALCVCELQRWTAT